MDIVGFGQHVLEELPFEPTDQQVQLVAALSRFCSAFTPNDSVFILNGYAGTGKTSVMAALVRTLRYVGIPTVLMASTGRAAKVFSNFTGLPAFTIHRKIYRAPTLGPDGRFQAKLCQNTHINTVFIVDEASMIGNNDDGANNLLEDLLLYVYSGLNNRLIFLGDTAQLPPVGLSESPAMDPRVLKMFGMRVTRATITKTVRQQQRSGILYNATMLRRAMKKDPLEAPVLTITPFPDMAVVEPQDLEEALDNSFGKYGSSETLLITRSNKRAVDFNLAIRRVIYDREEIIVKDERLLVTKNNYYWTRRSVLTQMDTSPAQMHALAAMEFIANGETAIVEKIYSTEKRGNLLFADAHLYFPDQDVHLDAKLNLETLTSDSASLSADKQQELVNIAMHDAGLTADASRTAIREAIKASPYANALQVKYAYAVTCHKAQGGQWASIFVDMGYIPPEAYCSLDFHRWLYTAITRATTHLTFINPSIEVR